MTGIVELEEKAVAAGEDFVSYELLMTEEQADKGPDPVELLRQEQQKIIEENKAFISQAREEAARIEKEAYDKGFAAGEEQGKKAGQEQLNEKINQAVELITQLQDQGAMVTQSYEAQLLPLIKAMVDKLVNHEVSVNPLVIEKCLQKALNYVVAQAKVLVHLHPEDFSRIKESTIDNAELLQQADNIELMEDPAITQGGCLLETDFGIIDATRENCRDNLYQALEQSFLAALAETD